MRHRLGTHDTGKLWHLRHDTDLTSDRFKPAHNYRQQIVKIVCNTAGQLTDGFKFLRLPQRCFGLISARNLFRYTLFKRRIELLKSQGCRGHFFPRAIESLSEVRCVMRRLRSGSLSGKSYVNARFGFQ